ncbi:hypothetical protein ACTHGU_05805 [Chitinophagaceae bacterium MMS25-I14]
MATINVDTISKITDCDELIDFIGINRYKPENNNLLESDNFNLLPDYAKYVIYIFDFETEYEMQGIFTTIENLVGHYFSEIAVSFEKTNNLEIANYIKDILTTLTNFGLTPDKIRHEWTNQNNQYNIIQSSFMDNQNLVQKINCIDENLQPLILEKGFWNNVTKFLKIHLT